AAARTPRIPRPCQLRSLQPALPRSPASFSPATPWLILVASSAEGECSCGCGGLRYRFFGTRGEGPGRADTAVSKCVQGGPGLSPSVPESLVLCGFQRSCSRVLSRSILLCAKPSGANLGAKERAAPT